DAATTLIYSLSLHDALPIYSKVIGVVSQKDEKVENPTAKDINKTGVVARILRVLKMPDGNTTVIIQGKKRFKVVEVITEKPYMKDRKSTRLNSSHVKISYAV